MAEEQHTGDESDNAMPTPKDAMGPHGLGTDDPERDWKAEYEKAMAERDKLVAQSRKWEERAKANKAKADKADQMEEASKTDAEKLSDAVKRAEKAESKLREYEAKAERDGIVHEVAEAKGVDRELLSRMSGDDRESVEANADWLKAKLASIPKYPTVDDNGGKTPPVTIERIEAIKDPAQRLKARAQHSHLYKH